MVYILCLNFIACSWMFPTLITALPWVPEAFHARFPVSVTSRLVSSACGQQSSSSHVRKNLWYPGYNSVRKPQQLSTTYCAVWLVDFWPITILVKYILIWLLCCTFLIENCSNKSTKSTSCFIFLFDISKITKSMKKILKKATVGISREIWCSNWETRRSDEKLGDSQENWESCQVWFKQV